MLVNGCDVGILCQRRDILRVYLEKNQEHELV